MTSDQRTAKLWAKLIEETKQVVEGNESPEQFQFRMERMGFVLDFMNPTNCQGMTDRQFFTTVIGYLNEKAGTTFRTKMPSANADLVLNLRKSGISLANFQTVIDKKCREWLNTVYQPALTPNILFSRKKFDNYLGQRTSAAPAGSGSAFAKLDAQLAKAKGDQ